MIVKRIEISKSKTLGVSVNNKTKYIKIGVKMEGVLEIGDDPSVEYSVLSSTIDTMLKQEQENLLKQFN